MFKGQWNDVSFMFSIRSHSSHRSQAQALVEPTAPHVDTPVPDGTCAAPRVEVLHRPVGDEVRMVLTKRKGHFGMVKCYRDKWYFNMMCFCHIMIITSHPFWWTTDDHSLIWCREACVVFHQMIFFCPGRVIACISWLHCSATLLMYHHPTSDITHGKMSMFYETHRKKLAPPPKKNGHPIFVFYGLIWIVRFEEFNSTNLKLPNAEVLGDGDMEPWASWPGGISEVLWCFGIPGGPSEVWCKAEKSHSDFIDL